MSNLKNVIAICSKNISNKCLIQINITDSQYKENIKRNSSFICRPCNAILKRTGQDISCDFCDKTFYLTKSRIQRNKNNFCSRECKCNFVSQQNSTNVNCSVGNKEFKVKNSYLKQVVNICCSKQCSNIIRSQSQSGKNEGKKLLSDEEKFFAKRVNQIITRCKQRNIDYNITGNDLYNIYLQQNKLCFYSKIPLSLNKSTSFDSVSVDRIDPNQGYLKDNIVLCLLCINTFKGQHKITDIKNVIKSLYNNYINKI